ncbi:apm1, partial [Symbiodinium sp. KB8]
MLALNPASRVSMEAALQHEWFTTEPLPVAAQLAKRRQGQRPDAHGNTVAGVSPRPALVLWPSLWLPSTPTAMVLSAIYFLDTKGKILIFRDYRGDLPRSHADKYGAAGRFSLKIQETSPEDLKPVYTEDGVNYVYIQHRNLYVLALSRHNSNVTTVLLFLYKLMDDYLGSVEEESIRDNFVLIYELLDEVCDFGYPQLSEVKILKEFVFQRGAKLTRAVKPPAAATNVVSWRPEGIVHPKNEVFLDVVEKLNLLVSSRGSVLSSVILGSVQMRSVLSGMPELKLGLNDKTLFSATGRAGKSVELEDIKFHQCVRLTKFDQNRTISFIPPDGDFELMSYRLNTKVKPLIWVETVVQEGRSKVDY